MLNAGPNQKRRRDLEPRDFGFEPMTGEVCPDDLLATHREMKPRSNHFTRNLQRRQVAKLTPGYVTTGIPFFSMHRLIQCHLNPFANILLDDFGVDGDDTPHSKIPNYPQPNDVQGKAAFPADGSDPKTVDLIFLDFIAKKYVIPALQSLGGKYTVDDIKEYLPTSFTTNSYLPAYAKLKWQAGVPNCPVGTGVGT